jgi:hypothetical protein
MSVKFELVGLSALRTELRLLPTTLAVEGEAIVADEAANAVASIIAQYPEVTGNLKGHVYARMAKTAFGSVARVISGARHANIYEHGTASRQTALGYNRGAARPGHVFAPTMERSQRTVYERLMALLQRVGLKVAA